MYRGLVAAGAVFDSPYVWNSSSKGYDAISLDWSGDGSLLGILSDNGWVTILDSNGRLVDYYRVGLTGIDIDWSSGDPVYAVAYIDDSHNYSISVFNKDNEELVKFVATVKPVLVSWSPSGEYLAIGFPVGVVVVEYDSWGIAGEALCQDTLPSSYHLVDAVWASDSRMFLACSNGEDTWILDYRLETGQIYRYGYYAWFSAAKIDWNSNFRELILASQDRILLVDRTGRVRVDREIGEVTAVASLNGNIYAVGLGNGSILYLNRGLRAVGRANLVGVVYDIAFNRERGVLTVSTSSVTKNIFTIRSQLLLVSSRWGAIITVYWARNGYYSAQLRGGERLVLWASPSIYNVTSRFWSRVVELGPSPNRISDVFWLGAGSYANINLTRIVIDKTGYLTLEVPYPSVVTIKWKGGEEDLGLIHGNFTFNASIGEYNVTYKLVPQKTVYIGSASALQGLVKTYVDSRKSTTVRIPSIGDLTNKVIIKGIKNTTIKITWAKGTAKYTMKSREFTFYAAPGEYHINYSIPTPRNFIGDPSSLRGGTALQAKKGETTVLEIPGYDEIIGTLTIKSNWYATINITWDSGQAEYTIRRGEVLEFNASAGNYNVSVYLKPPSNYIGWQSYLHSTYRIEVNPGKEQLVEIPSVWARLANLTIAWNGTATLNITMDEKLNYTKHLGRSGNLTVAVPPGYISITLFYDRPKYYVGFNDTLRLQRILIVKPGHEYQVLFPSLDSILSKITININAKLNEVAVYGVTALKIKNPDKGQLVVWAVPKPVIIIANYTKPKKYFGPPEHLIIKKEIILVQGEEYNITVPSLKQLTALLTLLGEPNANITITYPHAARNLSAIFSRSQRFLTIIVAKNLKYTIIYSIPPPSNYYGVHDKLIIKKYMKIDENKTIILPTYADVLRKIKIIGKGKLFIKENYNGQEYNATITVDSNKTIWIDPKGHYQVYIEPPGGLRLLYNSYVVDLSASELIIHYKPAAKGWAVLVIYYIIFTTIISVILILTSNSYKEEG